MVCTMQGSAVRRKRKDYYISFETHDFAAQIFTYKGSMFDHLTLIFHFGDITSNRSNGNLALYRWDLPRVWTPARF